MIPIRYFIILLIYFSTTEVNTYRILAFFPAAYKSHNIFFQALMKGLVKRGHQVDVISHFELENPPKNYKTILNLASINFTLPTVQFNTIQQSIDAFKDKVKLKNAMFPKSACKLLLQEKMQQILQNTQKDSPYDLIMTEAPGIVCFLGLGPYFNRPLITLTASMETPWTAEYVGNPMASAFLPVADNGIFDSKNFWDRFKNTIYNLFYRYIITEDQTEEMRKYLRSDIPKTREVERMVALSLVNSHHTIQGNRPTTPAFIEVGGLHIEENDSNFTTELEKWFDESENGVIYFSLGTSLPLETLPKKTILSIYSSFSKLAPVRFLIKATDGYKFPPGLPKNVLTMNWIPQISVLKHKNTRIFMTHGGLHSVQETIYYGVPIIGIPIFFDQLQNVQILVNKKMGIQLNHDKITEKSLDEALIKILKDSKYREAARNYSRIFQDRPMSPMNTATYWIEYIIRNGAESLRSPAVKMYSWQVELLDVYGFLLFCIVLVLYVITIIVKNIFKLFFMKNIKLDAKKD